jgi:hypothetical protein
LLAPGGELMDVVLGAHDPSAATRQLIDEGRAPTHPAVMFRRSAYFATGGYRTEFRVAQDHDLWYQLIERGQLAYIPDLLFTRVLDETGISATGRHRQQRLGELARDAYLARSRGESEQSILEEARQISGTSGIESAGTTSQRRTQSARSIAMVNYFIGSRLAAHRDPRCRRYFRRAIQHQPWHGKAWLQVLKSYVTCGGRDPGESDLIVDAAAREPRL